MASKRAPNSTCRCGERPDCGSDCTGLDCLERPRFFSGQLLTEAELNSEQAYVLAKNRLHNLHLHGWGVVCGLEVTCHECPGWVTVHPGYAIDSCGNDVIVCKAADVNVADEIRRCKEARRKLDDCRCPPGANCDEQGDEHWCLVLSYLEKEARPTTALNQEPGGCGCQTPTTADRVKSGVGKAPYSCEPTRILESWRLELCEAPEDWCAGRLASGEQAWIDKFKACVQNFTKSIKGFPTRQAMRLGGGLLARNGLVIDSSFSANPPPQQVQNPVQVQRDLCTVLDFLRELFRKNPGNLHCAAIERLEELDCPTPGANDTFDSYWNQIQPTATTVLGYLLLYFLDCFCHAALPPCAPCCPGEDPLILACMTVRDGRVVDICNYSCRRLAGAFPPSLYGIYLGPFLPLLTPLLKALCCGDIFERLLGLIRDKSWARATAGFFAGDSFANSSYIAREGQRLWTAANAAPPEEAAREQIALSRFAGQPTEQALAAARQRGLVLTVREVGTVPLAARLTALDRVAPGETVVAYSRDGQIVGFARGGSTEAGTIDQAVEVAALRQEVETLKTRLAAVAPPTTGKKRR